MNILVHFCVRPLVIRLPTFHTIPDSWMLDTHSALVIVNNIYNKFKYYQCNLLILVSVIRIKMTNI